MLARTAERAELTMLDDGSAAALWIRPDRPLEPDDYAAVEDLLAARLGSRAAEIMGAIGSTGPHRPATPHRTLLNVAVLPEARGQGAGGRVLAPILDRTDVERIPVYLNSTNPRNVAFYERLGFNTLADVAVTAEIRLRPMWRVVS